MTNVRIFRKNERILGFEVTGHAGFADYGEDIVCSAISMLTTNTLNSMMELLKLEEYMNYEYREGKISLRLDDSALTQAQSDDAQLLLNSFELGIHSIEEEYPAHITLRIEEV